MCEYTFVTHKQRGKKSHSHALALLAPLLDKAQYETLRAGSHDVATPESDYLFQGPDH